MEFGEFSQDFAKEVRLKWDFTDPCDELGKHKQVMLLPWLGKLRAFPRAGLCFGCEQVCGGGMGVLRVGSSLPRWSFLDFGPLLGAICILSFIALELQLLQLARH